MLNTSSAFFSRLQGDGVNIAEIIDLTLNNGGKYHWTSANQKLTYTLSGVPTVYDPFPGKGDGFEEDMSLGVSVINFVLANSGSPLQQQLINTDFAQAQLQVGYIFTDTPDLGRMDFYKGKIGDFAYNRMEITGQARNLWKSLNIQWPYYTYNEKCGWRFGSAGCGFNTASITVQVNSGVTTDGQTFTFASGTLTNTYTNGRLIFGRATITTGANSGTARTIMAHSGDQITLSHPLNTLDTVNMAIYAGCNKRLLDDCHSLYNNDKNFFGFPWMPTYESAF
jgi:hypothetical protein